MALLHVYTLPNLTCQPQGTWGLDSVPQRRQFGIDSTRGTVWRRGRAIFVTFRQCALSLRGGTSEQGSTLSDGLGRGTARCCTYIHPALQYDTQGQSLYNGHFSDWVERPGFPRLRGK